MNAFIVIAGLYVLGYLNPDTSEAFMWAGLVVGVVISVAGLVWAAGRIFDRKKPVTPPVRSAPTGAERRLERRNANVPEAKQDKVVV